MDKFKKALKIQKAFSIYIVKSITEKSDFQELKTMFAKIDTNHDGRLTKDELIVGILFISI